MIPEVWNDSEWLQRQFLICRRIPNDTSTKKVRKMLSYAMSRRQIRRPGRAIVEAAHQLVGLGILERIGYESNEKHGSRKREAHATDSDTDTLDHI